MYLRSLCFGKIEIPASSGGTKDRFSKSKFLESIFSKLPELMNLLQFIYDNKRKFYYLFTLTIINLN